MNTNEKRYTTLTQYYKNRFHDKIFKVALNGNFSCPNKDGSRGFGGCTYCSPLGSGDYAGDKTDDLFTQFENVKTMMHEKWPQAKYIAYFQANTNTYAPVEELKAKFEPILALNPAIVGLAISTRPDCLPDDVVEYLSDLNQRTQLFVELGLQSIHDESSLRINRGHDLQTFVDGVKKLRAKNIEVIVHIINGLPDETQEMMCETVQFLSHCDIQGIKIHMLHVIKHTKMGMDYLKDPFPLLSQEDYVLTVVKQLELLPPHVVIHRLTGDAVREELIAPLWTLKKWEVLNAIDHELSRQNTYQGRCYDGTRP